MTRPDRVLRPGGWVGVSDVVAEDQLTADDWADWLVCTVAGLGGLAGSLLGGRLQPRLDERLLTGSPRRARHCGRRGPARARLGDGSHTPVAADHRGKTN